MELNWIERFLLWCYAAALTIGTALVAVVLVATVVLFTVVLPFMFFIYLAQQILARYPEMLQRPGLPGLT